MEETEKQEEIRLWHERDKDKKFTGRSVAILWEGNNRYVGISTCSHKDQFSRPKGRMVSIGRAKLVHNGLISRWKRPEFEFKKGFKFNVFDLGADGGHEQVKEIVSGFPEQLYRQRPAFEEKQGKSETIGHAQSSP